MAAKSRKYKKYQNFIEPGCTEAIVIAEGDLSVDGFTMYIPYPRAEGVPIQLKEQRKAVEVIRKGLEIYLENLDICEELWNADQAKRTKGS